MKTVQFLSNSPQIEKISKGFSLSRSLFVSSLLIGEEHTGKKTFIQTLFPNRTYVDASNESELLDALDKQDELIIQCRFQNVLEIRQLAVQRIIMRQPFRVPGGAFTQLAGLVEHFPRLQRRLAPLRRDRVGPLVPFQNVRDHAATPFR